MDTMIRKLPAVALRGMVILPGMIAHFDISREKSIRAIEESMMDEQHIFLVAQRDIEQENPVLEDVYKIGTIAEVKQVIKLQNNVVRVLVEGKERAELATFLDCPDYLFAEVIRFEEEEEELFEEVKQAMIRSVQETFSRYLAVNPKVGKDLQRHINDMTDIQKLIDLLANNLPVHYEEKQKILDAVSLTERYEVLMALSICAVNDPKAKKAVSQLDKLRNCELHSTVMLAHTDEKTLKSLGIRVTCEPERQILPTEQAQ